MATRWLSHETSFGQAPFARKAVGSFGTVE
jgi:hypothetical protein